MKNSYNTAIASDPVHNTFSEMSVNHYIYGLYPRSGSCTRFLSAFLYFCIIFVLNLTSTASAQLATAGAGILTSNRPPEPVFELHGATPPFALTRAYITLSWTKSSLQPTVITAAEHTVLQIGSASTGLGPGLLWLEANNYKPYPMIVSSTVVPLPIPRTSFVLIGSVLPFEDFDWSVVFKIGVTLFFDR